MQDELVAYSARPAHARIVAAATGEARAPGQKRTPAKLGRPPTTQPLTARPPLPFDRPAYMDIPTWCAYTGMNRTSVYEAVAFGELTTIKVGRRRLVDVEESLAWLRSLAPSEAA
jgi:hypothetical protein